MLTLTTILASHLSEFNNLALTYIVLNLDYYDE